VGIGEGGKMPKTWATPRDELVCGKLDVLQHMAKNAGSIEMLDLIKDVRHDCERMEQGLIRRRDEVRRLKAEAQAMEDIFGL